MYTASSVNKTKHYCAAGFSQPDKDRIFQCITHEEYFDSPPQRGTELVKETAEGYAPPPPPPQAMPLLPTPPTDEPYLRLRREKEDAEEGQGAKDLRFGLRNSLHLLNTIFK